MTDAALYPAVNPLSDIFSSTFWSGAGAGTKGKVALVTGAARGIGQSIALKLAAAGADIAVCDLEADWLADTCEQVTGLGRRAGAYACDVSRGEDVQAAVKAPARITKRATTVDRKESSSRRRPSSNKAFRPTTNRQASTAIFT